eukprot:scaffold1006_cov270-Pinguiococcus_pyrenoidosus.AAC.5
MLNKIIRLSCMDKNSSTAEKMKATAASGATTKEKMLHKKEPSVRVKKTLKRRLFTLALAALKNLTLLNVKSIVSALKTASIFGLALMLFVPLTRRGHDASCAATLWKSRRRLSVHKTSSCSVTSFTPPDTTGYSNQVPGRLWGLLEMGPLYGHRS